MTGMGLPTNTEHERPPFPRISSVPEMASGSRYPFSSKPGNVTAFHDYRINT